MIRNVNHSGIIRASLLAGPVFLVSLGLATLYAQLPAAIEISPAAMGMFAIGCLIAVPTGFIIALVPCAIGTAILACAGERSEIARARAFWILVGAALGMGISRLFLSHLALSPSDLAFVIVSSFCAALCHGSVSWVDEPKRIPRTERDEKLLS